MRERAVGLSNAAAGGAEEPHQTEISPGSYPKFIVAINSALQLVHDQCLPPSLPPETRDVGSKTRQARKGKGGKKHEGEHEALGIEIPKAKQESRSYTEWPAREMYI